MLKKKKPHRLNFITNINNLISAAFMWSPNSRSSLLMSSVLSNAISNHSIANSSKNAKKKTLITEVKQCLFWSVHTEMTSEYTRYFKLVDGYSELGNYTILLLILRENVDKWRCFWTDMSQNLAGSLRDGRWSRGDDINVAHHWEVSENQIKLWLKSSEWRCVDETV